MEQVEQINEPECTPRRFWEIPLLWLKFWIMDEEFFRNEKSHVDILNTIFGFLLFAAILPITQAFFINVSHQLGPFQMTYTLFMFEPNSGDLIQGMYFRGLYLLPIILYAQNSILFVIAKLFSGKGNFSTQAYFLSLVIPPIYFISTLFWFSVLIPVIGTSLYFILMIGVNIYYFLCVFRALKVTHDISFLRTFLLICGFIINLQIFGYLKKIP
jgi:hypothetical protein